MDDHGHDGAYTAVDRADDDSGGGDGGGIITRCLLRVMHTQFGFSLYALQKPTRKPKGLT